MNDSYPTTYGYTIGSGAQKGAVSNMYIHDPSTLSYTVGVVKDMENVAIAELGFSSAIWVIPTGGGFPDLINNPFTTYEA